ncbi:hypothetical protein HY003_00930 [Candidatus Saccharibacteria bacterium]|nr:hypothetical protein [Candidatus Saccharibacteria bacterium]MBI3337847.1 hypothetical protein [Candidatus Saccharibacteria bacterium]
MEDIGSPEKYNRVVLTPYETYILCEALEYSPNFYLEYPDYESYLEQLQELVECGNSIDVNFSGDVSDETIGFFALALEKYQSAVQDCYDESIEYPITFRKWLQRFVERRTMTRRLPVVKGLKELFIREQTKLMLESIDQQNT